MKKLLIALFLVLLPTLASAQSQRNPCFYPNANPGSNGGCIPVSSVNPLPVNATVTVPSVTVSGFHIESSLASINPTTTAATSATFTAGKAVLVQNVGTTNNAYCVAGSTSSSNAEFIAPQSSALFQTTTETTITCVTTVAGGTNINLQVGTGLWTGSGGGGGSGGGSGGTVTQGPAGASAWLVTGTGGTFPVTGTFWQSTQPVSAASLPLPTGAGTSANQTTINTSLGTLHTDLTTLNTTASGPASLAVNVTPTDCSGTVSTGGTAVNAFTAQTALHGFTILNDDTSEPLWISFTTTAAASTAGSYPLAPATPTTFAGANSFTAPPGFGTNHALSVVAATSAHKFSCTWW